MSTDIIPIRTQADGTQAVSGRALHEFLEVSTEYRHWFPRMAEYGLTEGTDYAVISDRVARGGRGEVERTDHVLTIDAAKEIAMLQRSERGKQARAYFIEVEKRFKSQAQLSDDEILHRALTISTGRVQALEAKVSADAPKVAYVESHVIVDDDVITIDMFASQFNSTGPIVRELMRTKGIATRKLIGERWSKSKQMKVPEYEWRPRQGLAASAWFVLRAQHNVPRLHNGQVRQTMYVKQVFVDQLASKLGLNRALVEVAA